MISRYEIKFSVSSAVKESFLQAAAPGLCPDEHGVGNSPCYRVTSLYYDSADRYSYWEKLDGEGVRQKVRLRYYGDLRESTFEDRPFFLEVKHRIKDSVYKDRMPLEPKGAVALLEDASLLHELTGFISGDPSEHQAAMANVEYVSRKRDLEQANVISYLREAWMGKFDHRLRITFDRTVHAYAPWRFREAGPDSGIPLIPDTMHIMELKFNESVPRWVRDLVISHELVPRRFSKYATGIDALRFANSLDTRATGHHTALAPEFRYPIESGDHERDRLPAPSDRDST